MLFTLNIDIVIKVILICFICLSMWANVMMLALKLCPQIAVKTGNLAGLLFRRIWYSVGKSGVLGITEYRQGRPLMSVVVLFAANMSVIIMSLEFCRRPTRKF